MSRDTHVTVAVIVERDGKFLFVEERVGGQLVINQPAGHWEDGESFAQGAAREALEETGWHVEPTHVLGVYEHVPGDLDYGFLRMAFIARPLRHDAQRALDTGIERAVWLSRGELAECQARHRSPMVLRCVDDYLAGRRFPLDMLIHLKNVIRNS